jgi:hypothetical protein
MDCLPLEQEVGILKVFRTRKTSQPPTKAKTPVLPLIFQARLKKGA